jgi:DNA repair protein RecO (recombination protein O)
MPIVKSEAIFLKGTNWRESSRILTAFSRDYGKVKLVAKGARRPKSKYGAALEPLTHAHVIFYMRENRDLYTLSEAGVLDTFEGVKGDLEKFSQAAVASEMLERSLAPEEANPGLFHFFIKFLQAMDEANPASGRIFLLAFQLNLSAKLGFEPQIVHCLGCRKKESPAFFFSTQMGGILCERCLRYKDASAKAISKEALAALRHLQVADWEEISRLALPEALRKELDTAMAGFLEYHEEHRQMLKSTRFMRAVTRTSDGAL